MNIDASSFLLLVFICVVIGAFVVRPFIDTITGPAPEPFKPTHLVTTLAGHYFPCRILQVTTDKSLTEIIYLDAGECKKTAWIKSDRIIAEIKMDLNTKTNERKSCTR